ncbi:MAG: gluconate 2-dehydrogenase subunit 3 family protein [Pseudomonadales bacterium]|jgi:hypothetical protein|nr:gluconate 2-dehydrogenase subunit 3 family protein [Pseudomonadales bacterium]MDP6472302.1 gluconate 2-dehydrogenase subunit 3 family protein [Pseudomonadales bacterium]MDP6828098.1 gluconate 2-dehydrogenase subunit 3 family protein [Pseudomonadales bacterium]MDP6971796.1 gluconate 2-dehydrogenase subunit 3 family protein [Pseudomonadales bacterium]|tara:strand:+ start:697 stop:1239 length:543 start_codon:yes stop_codon:yes gene_type:complete
MQRRELLKLCAAALGAQISAACTSAVMSPSMSRAEGGVVLNVRTKKRIAALAEVIIPATDTPGASEAGVPGFIESLLTGWSTAEEREAFLSGLGALDQAARERHAAAFEDCTFDQQSELFAQTMAGDTRQKAFFAQAREAAVVGYFTSEVGATQALQFLPVPGRYDGAYPVSAGDVQFTF